MRVRRPGRRLPHLRAGQDVIVRPPLEILAALDERGTLDGVPFMPEMVASCGKRFRVSRRVEKTCVEGHWSPRRFPGNDVVFLDEVRCSGDGHDGCRRGCMIFWKEAWLQPVAPDHAPTTIDPDEVRALLVRLRVRSDPAVYFCQSTELSAATRDFPPHWAFHLIPRMLWVAIREVWVGNRSVREALGLMLHHVRLTGRRNRIGDRVIWMPGPNRTTPTLSLGLQAGEWVKTKSEQEVRATLDPHSRNRGLRMTVAMAENCGREFRVRERVDRIISERTGEMRQVENTVSLEGLECMCAYVCGGCPRGELQYWREIWLERPAESTVEPAEQRMVASPAR